MPRKTLLERALNDPGARPRLNVTDEEIDLALAWMRDEVNLGQVSRALADSGATGSGNALYRIAVCLREAHRKGQLQMVAA